jgi:hypothetical protein
MQIVVGRFQAHRCLYDWTGNCSKTCDSPLIYARDWPTSAISKDHCPCNGIPNPDLAISHGHKLFRDMPICHDPSGWMDKETCANDEH